MPTRRQMLQSVALAPLLRASGDPSFRSRVRPIEPAEYEARRERARELMAANKLDAIILMGGSSMLYFAGLSWGRSERTMAIVFPRQGEPVTIVPAFEEERALEILKWARRTRPWQEEESPYQLIAQALKEYGARRVGIEETVPYFVTSGISEAAPGVDFTLADPVTAGCRRIKSPREIELMTLGGEITLAAYREALGSLRDGITAAELGRAIAQAHQKLGFSGGALVGFGPYAAFPHGSVAAQKLKEGDIVLVDGGTSVEGYKSDITRTTVFGKPTDRQRRVWDLVRKAQDTALKAARPGVPMEAIDAAARKVIEDGGFGPGYRYFTHRVGHGIGLDGHEWPYLVKGNKAPLAAGMMFSDEPGVYIRGEFGVRLEDEMLITPDGARLLTKPAVQIEQPVA